MQSGFIYIATKLAHVDCDAENAHKEHHRAHEKFPRVSRECPVVKATFVTHAAKQAVIPLNNNTRQVNLEF